MQKFPGGPCYLKLWVKGFSENLFQPTWLWAIHLLSEKLFGKKNYGVKLIQDFAIRRIKSETSVLTSQPGRWTSCSNFLIPHYPFALSDSNHFAAIHLNIIVSSSDTNTVENILEAVKCLQTEKAMAPHSSTLALKIPWTEEPGRLQSTVSLRVRHDWATSLSLFTFIHWRRKWQPRQCSCLETPRDGGAWWAAVYGVAQSQTRLKWLSSKLL